MLGVSPFEFRLLLLLLAQAFSCATVTLAEPAVLAFRAQGLTGLGRDRVVAWSETGQLQVLTSEGKTQGGCRLSLRQLDQLLVSGGEIYATGSLDASTRAVLRIDTHCDVLDRWTLTPGWAELATDPRGIVIVTSQYTADIRPGGLFGPKKAHVRRGPERRPAPSALYWLALDGTAVLCRKRDLSMRGSSPGWCALQRPDGWVVTGEWDGAVACGGYVIVRTGAGAERVRWESLRLDTGQKMGSATLHRGAYRCAGGYLVVADGGRLKFLEPGSLKVSSTLKVTAPVEQIEVLSDSVVYSNGDRATIRPMAAR